MSTRKLMSILVLLTVLTIAALRATADTSIVRNGALDTGSRTVSSADSTSPIDSQTTYGQAIKCDVAQNVTLALSCATSAATGKVTIVWGTMRDGLFIAYAAETSATLTAHASLKLTNGKYFAGKVTFQTTGYTHFFALVTTISGGDAEVRWTIN